jgi:hypothetical protein
MACSYYTKLKCSVSTGSEDEYSPEVEDRAARLCLWTGCGCLPPRHRTEPERRQLALFDVGDYGGRRTTLLGRRGL